MNIIGKVLSAVLIISALSWNAFANDNACEFQKKIIRLPKNSWNGRGSNVGYEIERDAVYLPDSEMPGKDVYPAFRPEGYLRALYRFSNPYPKQGPGTYIISYYGRPGKGRDGFQEVAGKLREDGFNLDIERTVFRDDFPPCPYDGRVIYFDKPGIAGSVESIQFHDFQCQKWSIIRYIFNLYGNS